MARRCSKLATCNHSIGSHQLRASARLISSRSGALLSGRRAACGRLCSIRVHTCRAPARRVARTHKVHGAVEEGDLQERGRARHRLALPALLACAVLEAHLDALPPSRLTQHAGVCF